MPARQFVLALQRKMKNAQARMNMQNFFKNIFASEIGSESPRIKTFLRDVKATWVRGLKCFIMVELEGGVKHLRGLG